MILRDLVLVVSQHRLALVRVRRLAPARQGLARGGAATYTPAGVQSEGPCERLREGGEGRG